MPVHPDPLSDQSRSGRADRAIIDPGHADVTEHPRESGINAQLPVDKSGLRKPGFGAAAGPAAGRQVVDLRSGPVWRIAAGGVTKVYLNRVLPHGRAAVSSQGRKGWASNQIIVGMCDLFHERADAQHEYRHRRAEAVSAGSSLNLTRGPVNYKPSAAELRDGDAAYWAARASAA